MAFRKTITARGASGSYIRLAGFRWDPNAREASALFSLFVDKTHADRSKPTAEDRDRPLIDIVAKVRVTGDAFDQYLSSTALEEGATNAGADILAHLYTAAKAASREAKTKGTPNRNLQVVSDFGADLFADAQDV